MFFNLDLNYSIGCDYLIELSNKKQSDNNLASKIVENRSVLSQLQSWKW